MRTAASILIVTFACLLSQVRPAHALVIGQESDPTTVFPTLDESGVAPILYGTAGAIGQWHMVTARHVGVSPGTTFQLGGDTFEVADTYTLDPPGSLPPDIEVFTVRNLTRPGTPLPTYYPLTLSVPSYGQECVLLGTGHTGTSVTYRGRDYFVWDAGTPRLLRWGTNSYEYADTIALNGPDSDSDPDWQTETLVMRYDVGDTPYEVGAGDHDSGSPVLYNDGGTWRLAGIVESIDGYSPTVDGYREVYAVSVTEYYGWLSQWVAQPGPGDANLDGTVDELDADLVRTNWGLTSRDWVDGDFDGSGQVDLRDASILLENWQGSAAPTALPEPASLALLPLITAALLRPRKAA